MLDKGYAVNLNLIVKGKAEIFCKGAFSGTIKAGTYSVISAFRRFSWDAL